MNNRFNRLLPGGKPRYIRCYDNGGIENNGGQHWYIGMSGKPFHPQGIGQHGGSDTQIDYPSYGHLGKKIQFDDLPEDCKKAVLQDYVYLWDIKEHPLYVAD